MAKFLCDIGSLLVGIIAGTLIGKYGKSLSERLSRNYASKTVLTNWEEECEAIEGECECDLDDY